MKKATQSVGSFAAKTHFSKLLEQVVRGNVIEITRRGVPVARLVPVERSTESDRVAAILEIRRLAKGQRLGRLSVRQLIEEGRRF